MSLSRIYYVIISLVCAFFFRSSSSSYTRCSRYTLHILWAQAPCVLFLLRTHFSHRIFHLQFCAWWKSSVYMWKKKELSGLITWNILFYFHKFSAAYFYFVFYLFFLFLYSVRFILFSPFCILSMFFVHGAAGLVLEKWMYVSTISFHLYLFFFCCYCGCHCRIFSFSLHMLHICEFNIFI